LISLMIESADSAVMSPKLTVGSKSAAKLLAVDAAALMEQHRITSVLVTDAAGQLCGALNSNDLLRAKVI
jgi:CBS domain-containing protein